MAYRVHPVITLANGHTLALAVHRIDGSRPGPTVGITAGVHGDEANGPEIVYRFLSSLDPTRLRGTLLVCPVANPLAYGALARFSPIDGLNLNRIFPGDPAGMPTERLAALLVRELLDRVDAYVDVHSGGLLPTVDYAYILNDERLSRVTGFPVLYRPVQDFPGTATRHTVARGVPSVVLEIGGGAVAQEPYTARGVEALRRILQALGSLEGEPPPPPPQTVVRRIVTVRPAFGGLLLPEAIQLGATLPQGSVLGRVINPYTLEPLETLTADLPESLLILAHLRANRVEAGDYGYMLGDLATREAPA